MCSQPIARRLARGPLILRGCGQAQLLRHVAEPGAAGVRSESWICQKPRVLGTPGEQVGNRSRLTGCRKHFARAANDTACYKIVCSRREVGPLASKPGEPIKRYASGKFLRLDIEGALTPVPGTGEETLDGSLYSRQRFPRPCGSGSRSSS